MSLSTLRNHTLVNEYSQCWYNAIINANAYRHVYGLELKWVVGAVKFHAPRGNIGRNGFMDDDENTLRTPEDLRTNWDDTHAWLEDDEGLVYDCIMEEEYAIVRMIDPYRRRFKMDAGFIVGESYASLKKKGYELIPYPEESKRVVMNGLRERQRYNGDDGTYKLNLLMHVNI